MGFLIKAITWLFSKKENLASNQVIPDENLPIYHGKIEVGNYIEFKYIGVNERDDYLFKTPDEILKILNNRNLLWVDEKNDLLGYSSVKRSKLFILSEVKGLEIQNMLPAKGGGGSWIVVRLLNGGSCEIAEAGEYSFDEYVEEITQITGLSVTMLPEYYNC